MDRPQVTTIRLTNASAIEVGGTWNKGDLSKAATSSNFTGPMYESAMNGVVRYGGSGVDRLLVYVLHGLVLRWFPFPLGGSRMGVARYIHTCSSFAHVSKCSELIKTQQPVSCYLDGQPESSHSCDHKVFPCNSYAIRSIKQGCGSVPSLP